MATLIKKRKQRQQFSSLLDAYSNFQGIYTNLKQEESRSHHKQLLCATDYSTVFKVSRQRLNSIQPRVSHFAAITRPDTFQFSRTRKTVGSRNGRRIMSAHPRLSVAEPSTPPQQNRIWVEFLKELYVSKSSDLKVQPNQKQQLTFLERMMATFSTTEFRELNCQESGLGTFSIRTIGKFLLQCQSIKFLILDRNCIGLQGFKVLAATLPGTSIIKLSLVSTNMNSESAKTLFQALKLTTQLTDLNVSSSEGLYRNRLGAEGVHPLTSVLSRNPSFHSLNANGSSISDQGFAYICEGLEKNKHIFSLQVSRNEIKQQIFTKFANKLASATLVVLDLSKNCIRDEGVILLSQMIGRDYKKNSLSVSLKTLNLRQNHITSLGLEHFSKGLSKNYTIQNVNLDQNPLSKGNRFIMFRNLLKTNRSITKLSLRNIDIRTQDVTYLGQGLEINTGVVQLDLSENNLAASVGVLCEMIKQNRTLKALYLAECNLGDQHMKRLVESISKNRCLEKIAFDHNYIKEDGADQLQKLLYKNKQIVSLKLHKNLISYTKAKELRRSVAENKESELYREPNMLPYEYKEAENKERLKELKQTVGQLERKYQEYYVRSLINQVVHYDIQIQETKKKLAIEKEKMMMLTRFGTFYTQHH